MRALPFLICVSLLGCGPASPRLGPAANLGATPSTLSVAQPTTVLKLITWDEDGNPGAGTAHFSSFVGALLEAPDVALTNGVATITYRCLPGTDQGCQGTVEANALWRGVNAPVSLQIR